jgi:RNA polymerase sigma factor (sigma-70 family)
MLTTDDGALSWVRSALARFEGPLTLYAARLLGDAESARDVVQDTFLRLCNQRRGEVEPRLAEWLFTVCRNRALDVLRKENRMTQLSDEAVQQCHSPDPSPLDAAESRESAARVLDLLDGLPASQREVIRLRFQNGFSYREISRISGHSVTNVGYLLHVGLRTLRGQLGPRDDGPPVPTGLLPKSEPGPGRFCEVREVRP